MKRAGKEERQKQIREELRKHPFLTDQELSDLFSVSVPTIRLDRQTMGIPQVRERMAKVAHTVSDKTDGFHRDVKILEKIPGESGLALMTTTPDMVNGAGFVSPEKLYGMAAALAEAVASRPFEATQIGNIKYKKPVGAGRQLIARARVVRMRGDRQYVWVFVTDENTEVFRAKFIMNVLTFDKEVQYAENSR